MLLDCLLSCFPSCLDNEDYCDIGTSYAQFTNGKPIKPVHLFNGDRVFHYIYLLINVVDIESPVVNAAGFFLFIPAYRQVDLFRAISLDKLSLGSNFPAEYFFSNVRSI